jgi:hypothetical protein
MDTHPINPLIRWLGREAASIPAPERTMEPRTDISALKARIAAGEYSLDADAIAEAMFGRADREMAGESEVLEAGEGHAAPGGIDEL